MPKYLCVRRCWDDCARKGSHQAYEEGIIYTFDKGIKPPRHFVPIKQDDDGDIDVIGQVTIPEKANPKLVARDIAAVKKVVKKVTGNDLPDTAFKKAGE